MKKTKKNSLLLRLLASTIVITIAYNMISVEALNIVDQKSNYKLPEYLLRYSEYVSKGNLTELNRIRSEMVTQLQRKESSIVATNGAVLQPNLTPDYYGQLWMQSVIDYSPTMYSIYGGRIGYIEYPDNIAGSMDYQYAHLEVTDWNLNPSNPLGGEAIIYGDMGDYLESAYIYVVGMQGPDTGQDPPGAQYWNNYVNVWAAQYSNGPWNWIGYTTVTGTSDGPNYAGIVYDYPYQYVAICCWYATPYPVYCDPTPDDVLIDGIYANHM